MLSISEPLWLQCSFSWSQSEGTRSFMSVTSKLRAQCAVTADAQCRRRDKLVSVCVLPSFLFLCPSCFSVATSFSSDVKIPLLNTLSVRKQKKQKKRKESRQRRVRTRNAVLQIWRLVCIPGASSGETVGFGETISEKLSCCFQKWSSTSFFMPCGYLLLQLDTPWGFQSCEASCGLGCPWWMLWVASVSFLIHCYSRTVSEQLGKRP